MAKIIKKIFNGRIVDLRIEQHRLPNGVTHDFEIVRHLPAAAVLPVMGDQILLIKQYRPAIGKRVWEIPAGLVEESESPLSCVKRELREETGYRGENFRKLGIIYSACGFTDEKIIIYQCDIGEKGDNSLELTEDITVHLLVVDQVREMLEQGEIKDSKTVIALQHYFLSP